MVSIVVALIVYYAAKWWMARYLTESHGLEKGFQLSALAFLFAFCVSWGAAFAVDWAFPSQAFNWDGLAALSGGGSEPGAKGADETLKAMTRALQAP